MTAVHQEELMHLFTRVNTVNPERTLEAIAFSLDIAAYVNETTDLELGVWSAVYGAPLGTISWTTRVDSQAAMGAAGDKLEADAKYQAKIADAAGLFTGLPEDQLTEFIGFAGSGTGAGQYATVTMAQCAPGKIAEAMAWGVDMMNLVQKVTGMDSSVGRAVYGPFATMGWITLAPDLAAVDAAGEAIGGDPTYIERLDQGGELFTQGSASSRLLRRLN